MASDNLPEVPTDKASGSIWTTTNTSSIFYYRITIGDNTVIGAKSVITKDIPSNVIAVGNPCRVLREITEQDSIKEEMKREEKNIE